MNANVTDYSDSNIFPSSTYSLEWYLVLCFLCFYAVTGVAGNALVLYVFSCRSDRLVSSLFIVALAIVDLTTCTLVIPGTIYLEYFNYWITSDVFCKSYYFFVASTILYSTFIMVAIAVDRYFCLCHPWKQAVTKFRAKVLVLFLAVLSSMHGVVMACANGIYQETHLASDPPLNCSVENVKKILDEDRDRGSMLVYACWQNHKNFTSAPSCQENHFIISGSVLFYYKRFMILIFGLCLLVVLILYLAIYRSVTMRRVRRMRNRRLGTQPTLIVALPKQSISMARAGLEVPQEANAASSTGEANDSLNNTTAAAVVVNNEKLSSLCPTSKPTSLEVHVSENMKIAFMLFIVTVVFAFSFLPAILILLNVLPHSPVVFYLYFINNLSNPVIYSFLNVNFRNKLKQLLCYKTDSFNNKDVCTSCCCSCSC